MVYYYGALNWEHFEVLNIKRSFRIYSYYWIISLFISPESSSTTYTNGRGPVQTATCSIVRHFVIVDSAIS
jgi:hypothetical protein